MCRQSCQNRAMHLAMYLKRNQCKITTAVLHEMKNRTFLSIQEHSLQYHVLDEHLRDDHITALIKLIFKTLSCHFLPSVW